LIPAIAASTAGFTLSTLGRESNEARRVQNVLRMTSLARLLERTMPLALFADRGIAVIALSLVGWTGCGGVTVMGGDGGMNVDRDAGDRGNSCGAARGPVGPSSQAPGTWKNVTPPSVDLSGAWLTGPSPAGAQNVLVDPARPGDVYLFFDQMGVWKSTDYGMTYSKTNTGANGDIIDGGRPWSAAIERNPCRDPATPPTIFVNAGFGASGLWKSTDGAVSFTNIYSNNTYSPDGLTNISAHVGSDLATAFLLETTNVDHLVLYMHTPPDNPAFSGIFETRDGGGKWILRQSSLFTFAPHADIFAPIDANIWIVDSGTLSNGQFMYRTIDGGASWTSVAGQLPRGIGGFQFARVGSNLYSSTETDGLYKTGDNGATWTPLPGSGGKDQWVVATKTKLYTTDGWPWDPHPTLWHASLDNDASWVSEPFPPEMIGNGVRAQVTFDGAHYIIIAAQHKAGAWRYVEP
jgi:hypothetical protein